MHRERAILNWCVSLRSIAGDHGQRCCRGRCRSWYCRLPSSGSYRQLLFGRKHEEKRQLRLSEKEEIGFFQFNYFLLELFFLLWLDTGYDMSFYTVLSLPPNS